MISAAWIEGKNRSTNHGSLHWRCVVQQWSDPQTWIKIVNRSNVGHSPVIMDTRNQSTRRSHLLLNFKQTAVCHLSCEQYVCRPTVSLLPQLPRNVNLYEIHTAVARHDRFVDIIQYSQPRSTV